MFCDTMYLNTKHKMGAKQTASTIELWNRKST